MVTREQATEQLKAVGVENPTDEQITTYLNNVNAEAIKEKSKADKYKEDADKAADLQKQLDDLQNQSLTDAEKKQKENEQLQQKIAELQANGFKSEAKAILKGSGMDDADIDALLPGMIAGLDKVEDVQARANAYVSAMNKVRDNAIKEHDKDVLDSTRTPGAGGNNEDNEKSNAEKIALKFFGEKKQENNILSHYVNGGN